MYHQEDAEYLRVRPLPGPKTGGDLQQRLGMMGVSRKQASAQNHRLSTQSSIV
jgi:hypothetical protein